MDTATHIHLPTLRRRLARRRHELRAEVHAGEPMPKPHLRMQPAAQRCTRCPAAKDRSAP